MKVGDVRVVAGLSPALTHSDTGLEDAFVCYEDLVCHGLVRALEKLAEPAVSTSRPYCKRPRLGNPLNAVKMQIERVARAMSNHHYRHLAFHSGASTSIQPPQSGIVRHVYY